MRIIGVVKFYNGKFGEIKTEIGIIDFEKKDISFNQEIKENDIVEFRLEEKIGNIKIARNITVVKKI